MLKSGVHDIFLFSGEFVRTHKLQVGDILMIYKNKGKEKYVRETNIELSLFKAVGHFF